MLPALVATLLWSYCVIAARRSVQQMGENQANLARLILALVALGLLAHTLGEGLRGGGLGYFLLSGIIGFGLGDIGIFYALPRIGSRLTLLMAQCVAVPVAGIAEWYWMGTTIRIGQLGGILLILTGITLALLPKRMPSGSLPVFLSGIAFGLLAALGQGLGAVLSRKAYLEARLAGTWTEPMGVGESILMGATAGYQRLIGGVLTVLVFFALTRFVRSWRTYPRPEHAADPLSSKMLYIGLTAASGPILGIICFQWALASQPSAIVQPIIAMAPLLVMPMAYFFEGDRPTARAVAGTFISVAGVIFLAFVG